MKIFAKNNEREHSGKNSEKFNFVDYSKQIVCFKTLGKHFNSLDRLKTFSSAKSPNFFKYRYFCIENLFI